ncbi:hypothetical protein AF72_02205 [Xylella taiwanensis]|uniref:Uncharacterized protein n=1 Tax=Xylella taiwanensis TaxID=1444770 RepID=Z9JMW6_9GAMM|nr:hypothetical protein AB672_09195 [Xylella taiwanensis]EWS79072.1 hypothetical protein AF72_02205 [Xylella taiwanensis]
MHGVQLQRSMRYQSFLHGSHPTSVTVTFGCSGVTGRVIKTLLSDADRSRSRSRSESKGGGAGDSVRIVAAVVLVDEVGARIIQLGLLSSQAVVSDAGEVIPCQRCIRILTANRSLWLVEYRS